MAVEEILSSSLVAPLSVTFVVMVSKMMASTEFAFDAIGAVQVISPTVLNRQVTIKGFSSFFGWVSGVTGTKRSSRITTSRVWEK